jgi:hypothetical protein
MQRKANIRSVVSGLRQAPGIFSLFCTTLLFPLSISPDPIGNSAINASSSLFHIEKQEFFKDTKKYYHNKKF